MRKQSIRRMAGVVTVLLASAVSWPEAQAQAPNPGPPPAVPPTNVPVTGPLPPTPLPPTPLVREIFVPAGDLDVLIESGPQRIYLPRKEYEELLSKAKQSPRTQPPLEKVLEAAEYSIEIVDGRVRLVGQLTLEILDDGVHVLGLDLAGVGIRRAALDGKTAALAKADDGRILLFVEGKGVHALTLEMTTALTTSAAQQSLTFQLPHPATARWQLTVPGNVELKSGASVVRRRVDNAAGTTQFELLATPGPAELTMSLNNRQLLQQRVVVARSVILDELTEFHERLQASVSLAVLHGATDRFRFQLPPGFDITEVASHLLARWSVSPEEPRVLEVILREPTTETVVLEIQGNRANPSRDQWSFPVLKPLEVVGYSAVLGLSIEDRLGIIQQTVAGLIPVDTSVLPPARSGRPSDDLSVASVHSIGAFYAPHGDFRWDAAFRRPDASVKVTSNFLLDISRQKLAVRAGWTLLPEREKVFEFSFRMAPGWKVTDVATASGQKLIFDVIANADPTKDGRVRVRLPQGLAPGQTETFYATVESVPSDWLKDWTAERTVQLPAMPMQGAKSELGAVAVHTQDDLEVRPGEMTGLTPLNDAEKPKFGLGNVPTHLAYRFETQPFQASFFVQKPKPVVTATTFNFLRVESSFLYGHYELLFDLRQGRTRQLALSLPRSTPTTLQIRGLGGVSVREYNSEDVEDRRHWTVLLADEQVGAVRIAVSLQMPLDKEEHVELNLPLAQADGVEYQSSLVAVEGGAELDVQVITTGRKIDVGELIDAEYQVGKRLLGAYEFVGVEPSVNVNVNRRPGYGLPLAIVERAELFSMVASHGVSQHAARYALRTKAAYLEVVLPEGAELWSINVDGKPALPQRDRGKMVVGFPPNDQPTRDLQIVYQVPIAATRWIGDLELRAPQLHLRSDEASEFEEVPVADLQWTLTLPAGHNLLRSGGNVYVTNQPLSPSPILRVSAILADFFRRSPWGSVAARSASPHAADLVIPYMNAPASGPAGAMGGLGDGEGRRGSVEMFGAQTMKDAADTDATVRLTAEPKPTSELKAEFKTPSDEKPAPAAKPAAPLPDMPAATEPAAPPAAGQSVQLAAPKSADDSTPARAPEGKTSSMSWAMQGVRSLKIDLQTTGDQVVFRSLGEAPVLRATVMDGRRLTLGGYALAGLVVLCGVLGIGWTGRCQAKFVVSTGLAALLVPIFCGALMGVRLEELTHPAFLAACLVGILYLAVEFYRWLRETVRGCFRRKPVAPTVTAAVFAMSIVFSGAPAQAQNTEPMPPKAESNDAMLEGFAELRDWIRTLPRDHRPVQLPEDAVIVPYDPAADDGIRTAEHVLVPYSKYLELWNLANPDKKLLDNPAPAPFAFAGAVYTATLSGDDVLILQGKIGLQLYREGTIEIPLVFAGGVLSTAKVDGKAARVRIIETPPATVNAANQAAGPAQAQAPLMQPPAAPALLSVLVDGLGQHELELVIRLRLQRSGGWRQAAGQLPGGPAMGLNVTVPEAQTEVRMANGTDRGTFETKQPNETIETALGTQGQFSLQWRPKVAETQVDQTLTARSNADFELREDGLRLAWKVDLELRGSQRDTFTLRLPLDYLLEKVVGSNIRGWELKKEAEFQRLEVTLLKAAQASESFTLRLSRLGAVGIGEMARIAVPVVVLPDAAQHRGQLTIHRGAAIDARVVESSGVSQTDQMQQPNAAGGGEESLLGVRPLAAFRFNATPFRLLVQASAAQPSITAKFQSLLRLSERATHLETRLLLNIRDRPVYRLRIAVPADLELQPPSVPVPFEWSEVADGPRTIINIFTTTGLMGEVPIVLQGETKRAEAMSDVALPRLELLDVARQEGEVVVQTDPAFDVRETGLQNCESILLNDVLNWLAPQQRPTARLAFRHRSPNYQGTLKVVARRPRVQVRTITNVRVTNRVIEDTILLDLSIQDAGVREVRFEAPAWLNSARIQVPLLRQKTITPIGDGQRSEVRLELQDDVTSQLRVLIENERPLGAAEHEAAIPVVKLDGIEMRIDHRYVTLESGGRDEVIVTNHDGLDALNRQQTEWQLLAQVIGNNISRAYHVRETAESHRFSFRTQQRDTVETAGARIGLSETRMVVDGSGAYRAEQDLKINNGTEQFLEIELPPGASLWTARVAGEPVKPTVVPGNASDRRVRIPLVKTATGDADYSVILKYGGQLGSIGELRTTVFPVIRTVNINVEWSQLRLRLSESHHWFNFGGTMHRRYDREDLTAGYLNYFGRQIDQISRSVSTANTFERARMQYNLKQLGQAMHTFNQSGNTSVASEYSANLGRLQDAERQIQQVESETASEGIDNRDQLNKLFEGQSNDRSRNVVSGIESNFGNQPVAAPAVKGELVNPLWFKQQGLGVVEADVAGAEELSKSLRKRDSADDARAKSNQLDSVQAIPQQKQARPEISGKPEGKPQLDHPVQRRGRVQDLKEQTQRYSERLETNNRAILEQDETLRENMPGEKKSSGGVAFDDFLQSDKGLAVSNQRSDSGLALASLDVNLPGQGIEYYFTSPRGDGEVRAMAVNEATIAWGWQLGYVLLALGVVLALCLVRAVLNRLRMGLRALVYLVLGVLSLPLLNPLVGCLLIVLAVGTLVRSYQHSEMAPSN